jgi:WD40 repeat protein
MKKYLILVLLTCTAYNITKTVNTKNNPVRLIRTLYGEDSAMQNRKATSGYYTAMSFSPNSKVLALTRRGKQEHTLELYSLKQDKLKKTKISIPTEYENIYFHSIASIDFSKVNVNKKLRAIALSLNGNSQIAVWSLEQKAFVEAVYPPYYCYTDYEKRNHTTQKLQKFGVTLKNTLPLSVEEDSNNISRSNPWYETIRSYRKVAINKKRDEFAAATYNGVELWNIPSTQTPQLPKFKKRLKSQYPLASVAYHPNKQIIAAGCCYDDEGKIIFWNTKKDRVVHTLSAHKENIMQIFWSPDGTSLASLSHDKTVKVWDTRGLSDNIT